MERFPAVISVTSRVILPLKYFCCCVKLKSGVRAITAIAGVIGVLFGLLGSEFDGDEYTLHIVAIACQATGFMFLLWFLTLLLFLSLDIDLPKKSAVWIGYTLSVWSLISFVGFIVVVVKTKTYDEARIFMICAVVLAIIAAFIAGYGVWTLKSYIYSLKKEEMSQSPLNFANRQINIIEHPTHIESSSPSSDSLRIKLSNSQHLLTSDNSFPEASHSSLSYLSNNNLRVKDNDNRSQNATNPLPQTITTLFQEMKEPLQNNVFFYLQTKGMMFSRSQQTSPTTSYSDLNCLN